MRVGVGSGSSGIGVGRPVGLTVGLSVGVGVGVPAGVIGSSGAAVGTGEGDTVGVGVAADSNESLVAPLPLATARAMTAAAIMMRAAKSTKSFLCIMTSSGSRRLENQTRSIASSVSVCPGTFVRRMRQMSLDKNVT